MEKELTLEDNGDIELIFNYRENDETQKLFDAKFSENAILDFEFYLPDSRGTSKRFKGGIMQFSLVPTPEVRVVNPPLTEIEEVTVTVAVFGASSENCIIPPLKRLDVPLESGRVHYSNFRSR
jgi:hypothetical protein